MILEEEEDITLEFLIFRCFCKKKFLSETYQGLFYIRFIKIQINLVLIKHIKYRLILPSLSFSLFFHR